MSDQQMADLYEKLVAGKANVKLVEQVESKAFLRGWNAGVDFAIKQQRIVCEEVEAKEMAE